MKLNYPRVVVGSCLSAALYAFNNRLPLIFTECRRPLQFEYLAPGIDLSCLRLPCISRTLRTIDGARNVGIEKNLLWERLVFLLSIEGLCPVSPMAETLRCDNNRMVVSNEYSKIMEIQFDICHYFADSGATGLIEKRNVDGHSYLCYDYIAFNSGGKHEIDYLHTGDDFVSEIWFYGSDRIDGNTPVRDACAISRLTREQLVDFDFSETMARFKTLRVMKDRGMKGKLNGYTHKGTPRHYDFRTTSLRRQIRSDESAQRSASPFVKVEAPREKALLRALPSSIGAFSRFLERLDENTP